MDKLNLIQTFRRWTTSQNELHQQIEKLQADNQRLREKVAYLQKAKDTAERQAEERKREKEALRTRLAEQKKANEAIEVASAQLNAKITELRNENENLRQKRNRA